jgi:hypothetical protein
VPRYLLQMHPEQKHAVVVDTQKSRLYLYQNDRHAALRRRLLHHAGQARRGKVSRGRQEDANRRLSRHLQPAAQKLTDFYGSGAFPINYPNEWDKRQGRNGHGIWLHGTPSDTFSRPPKASDGCVVLANQDLDSLAKSLQIGLTPVIISNSVEWLSLDDWQSERSSLLKMIEEWRGDWESRNTDAYARHYSQKFNADGQGYRDWIEHKRKVNAGKSWIKVGTGNISMFRNPGKEEYVVVTFEQDYRSKQPFQPDEEAPVLDQGRRPLEDRLRRRGLNPLRPSFTPGPWRFHAPSGSICPRLFSRPPRMPPIRALKSRPRRAR